MTRTRRLHRLTAKTFKEVKADLINHPRMTNAKLGKRYGMSGQTIGRIKACETWPAYKKFIKAINAPKEAMEAEDQAKKALEELKKLEPEQSAKAITMSLFDGEGAGEPVKSASQVKREQVQAEAADEPKKPASTQAIAAAVAKSVVEREIEKVKPGILAITVPAGYKGALVKAEGHSIYEMVPLRSYQVKRTLTLVLVAIASALAGYLLK